MTTVNWTATRTPIKKPTRSPTQKANCLLSDLPRWKPTTKVISTVPPMPTPTRTRKLKTSSNLKQIMKPMETQRVSCLAS
jgi:hypothetical protein